MTKKTEAASTVKTEAGDVIVDAEASYLIEVGRSVSYLGHVMRPRDRNIKVRGDALLIIAADFPGALVNVSQIQ